VYRLKRNVRRGVPFFLLAAFFLLCFMRVEVWGQESGSPQKTGFGLESVLTLTDVINLALGANRSLISSAYGVDSRKFSLDAAQSDFEWKLFPGVDAFGTEGASRIGAGVTVEKKFVPGPVAAVNPKIVRNYDSDFTGDYSGEFGISLTMPLLRGFGSEINLNSIRTAEYSLRTAYRSHYLVRVNIVLEAVSAVFDIVKQQDLVHLYQAQTKSFKDHAMMAKTREKVGLASPLDVYRAEIRLKDTQDSLTRALEALRSANDRLKIVLASPLEQSIQVTAPLDYLPLDITLDKSVATALKNRVELKQIDDQIEETRRTSRIAKNNLLPQLDLVANYTRLGEDDQFNRLLRLNENLWTINLTSTTDWKRTAEKAAYQQALLAVKTDELTRWTRIDSIKREVRQNFDSLLKAQERMQIRNEQINQARGKLALAKIKFGNGMANNFDVIEAETELETARVNLLAAKIEHIVGRYRLRAAMGTLIEYRKENGQTKNP